MAASVVSVVAGYAVWTVIFLGSGAGIRAARPTVHDSDGLTSDAFTLTLYLVCSVIASLVAGMVTVRLAPKREMQHVWILCGALLATGIPVQLSAGGKLPGWYNLAFLCLLVPVTWLGARLMRPRPE